MALNKRQYNLLRSLIDQGILDQPNIKLRKLPPVPPALAPLKNRKTDYASYLLANATESRGVGKAMSRSLASVQSAEQEEQSVLGQLFDTLMIPNYVSANIGEALAEGLDKGDSFLENVGDVAEGVGEAIIGGGREIADKLLYRGVQNLPIIGDKLQDFFDEGEEKLPLPHKTFQNVLHDKFGVDNKILRHGGGLALDIALDPLSYIGAGFLSKGRKARDLLDVKAAVGGSAKAFTKGAMPKAPSVAELALKGGKAPGADWLGRGLKLPKVDIPPVSAIDLSPRTRGLIRRQTESGLTPAQMRVARNQPIPNPSRTIEQKTARAQADWERAMTQIGKVAESTSRINMRAVNNVMQRIQEGAVPKLLPAWEVATGDALIRSKQIADDVIDSLMGQRWNAKINRWQGPGGKILSATRRLPKEITATQQLSLFSKIIGVAGPQNYDEALKMLRAAEEHLISLGVQPIRHEGVRVRLSDVLKLTEGKVSIKDALNQWAYKDLRKMDPVMREAIQTVAAYRSMTMADILENVGKYADKAKREVVSGYVGRQAVAAEHAIMENALAHGKIMGATSKELESIKNLIKDVVDVDKLPAERWLESASKQLTDAVNAGRANPELIVEFNNLVAKSFGYTAGNIVTKVSGHRPIDMIMTAFTTWWGKGQFLNPARGTFDAGILFAQARAEGLRKISQHYSADEIKNAWKLAVSNASETTAAARELELAEYFRNYFAEVLRVPEYGMKLSNEAIKHLSVAERSQMMMKDINRHLKDMNGAKAFQFTNSPIARDAWQVKRDFSATGEGWQASWAMRNPDDPLKFLFDIDLAMERATKEYAFLDNFAYVFGSLTKDAEHTWKMNTLDRISAFYVPEEVGKQMMRVMSDIHKGHWMPSTPLGRFHGKFLRVWKTGVTIYLPSHHIRNAIGDTYLMWLAGHNSPVPFIWAKRIMHSQKGRYKQAVQEGDFETLRMFTDPNAEKWAATQGKDVIIRQGDTTVTAEQLYVGALHRGLLKDANQLEDIFGESRIGIKPLGGRAHDAAASAAEYREHTIRLAHFSSAVNKSLKKGRKDLATIMDDAAEEVRKWHPDGTDLTRFEEKYLRNLVPFYSWLRKSTPLLVQSLVTRPAKNLAYPRGMVALQNMLGIDATMTDPFPDDQLFPEWIRDYAIGPIGDVESENPLARWWGLLGKNMYYNNGDPYGYTVVNPSNPLIDFGQQYLGMGPESSLRGLRDSLSPFIKVPLELSQDAQFTGAPIYKESGGQGVVQYLSKQIPLTAPLQRITDWRDRERVGEEKGLDIEALLNMLTAAGIHGTAPYIKGAEFEMKEKLRAQRNQ